MLCQKSTNFQNVAIATAVANLAAMILLCSFYTIKQQNALPCLGPCKFQEKLYPKTNNSHQK